MLKQVKKLERYKDFTFLSTPVNFDKFFKNKAYDVVQIHDITPIKKGSDEVIGFCGVFKWDGKNIKSIDHDSYTPDMLIYGYDEFTNNDEKCLDILVVDW